MKNYVKTIKTDKKLEINNKIKASLSKRLFAYLIDNMILVLLYAIPIKYIYSVVTKKIENKITLDMFELPYALIVFGICLFISFYYLIYLPVYKYSGKTIGKRIFGIKVVKEDGSSCDFRTMLIREGVGVILLEGSTYAISSYLYSLLGILINKNIEKILIYSFGVITIISIIYALFSKNHAMFHDCLAKTKVIETKE